MVPTASCRGSLAEVPRFGVDRGDGDGRMIEVVPSQGRADGLLVARLQAVQRPDTVEDIGHQPTRLFEGTAVADLRDHQGDVGGAGRPTEVLQPLEGGALATILEEGEDLVIAFVGGGLEDAGAGRLLVGHLGSSVRV